MKTPLTLLFILLLSFLETSANKKAAPSKSPMSPMSHKSYGFIQNKGQIVDQNNKPNKEALYLYNSSGLHVQLRQNGFSYEVIKQTISSQPLTLGENNQETDTYNQQKIADSIYVHRIDILFEGGNKNVNITPFEPSTDYINYYTTGTGEAGVTNVHHYQKIVYTNVYPKIDVEFVLNPDNSNQKFKYNFIIHPGGNIDGIRLKFLGAKSTSLTENGHISIETAYGNIDESIPYSYQLNDKNQQKTVLSKFTIIKPAARGQQPEANLFGIEAKNYDPGKTLVIDPTPWATYFGGSGGESASEITIDISGNIFIAGGTNSLTNFATNGAYQTSIGGNGDGYLAKFSSSVILLWATYYGGSLNDGCDAIACDTNGNVCVSGGTASLGNIASSGAWQTMNNGGGDAFIAKFNSSGIRQWATYYGGSEVEEAYDISIDINGNILASGVTGSNSGIATSGAWQTTFSGGNGLDCFIVKFNATGILQWGTYYGGSSSDYNYGIATDLNGNVVITGFTSSTTGIATSGAYQTVFAGGSDVFLAKFNSSGALQWATYYGSNLQEHGFALICDSIGNILITGVTVSTYGLFTTGAYQSTFGGAHDAFIIKFNAVGIPQWGTYFGGPNDEYGEGIGIDLNGDVLVTGWTSSSSGVATIGAYQTILGGGPDAFLTKFSASGVIQWATYFGSTGTEFAFDVCSDKVGNVLACGWTNSSSGIATSGAWQTTLSGIQDALIVSIPNYISISPISNNTISSNQAICSGIIPALINGSLPTGGNNIFLYNWLSSTTNASIGYTLASGTNNAINYSPPALTTSTWYKRVVNSAGIDDTSNVVAILVGSVKLNVGFTVNAAIQCIKTNNFIFTDTSSGSNTHFWDFGNGLTSTLANPTISYNFNIANAYWVKLESSINGGCIDSAKQRVYVINNPAPTGAIIGNSMVTRLSTHTYSVPATMGSSYQWLFTNGIVIGNSTSNTISIKWNLIGIIDLKVVEFTGGGCAGDTVYQTITINPGVGLEGIEVNNKFIIYPNPTNGVFTISSNIIKPFYVNVYDVLGRLVFQIKNQNINTEISMDLSPFGKGIYSVQLIDENGNSYSRKIHLIE